MTNEKILKSEKLKEESLDKVSGGAGFIKFESLPRIKLPQSPEHKKAIIW